ncbi:MAG: S8 family serine peptidase [Myxococcota bacterium]
MQLRTYRSFGSLVFTSVLAAYGLLACAETESAPSSSSASSPVLDDAANKAGAAPHASDSLRSASADPAASSGKRARVAISTESLVLTLREVPEHLSGKALNAPAWLAWLQSSLGEGVRVVSARTLNPALSDVPQLGEALVVSVASTSEARIREACARAELGAGVAKAEADPIWHSDSIPNDPRYGEQWQWPKVQAPQAWDTANGSANVIVAVIDSGIDATHPDLVNALWSNPFETADGVDNDKNGLVDDVKGWNFLNNNNNLADSTGHGTHVAGLIGAQRNNGIGVAGIASGVKILPLVVGSAPPASAVASSIYYAADHGARIINMSFGGPETFSGARAAIDYAVARGALLIASAGNHSSDAYNYPAVYEDVVAVAATNQSDQRAILSNYGRWVDISAPGQDILSTFSNGGYFVVSGTSQASPIVAGVAALIKSIHPEWTADMIRTQLLASADDLTAGNPDYVGQLGAGRVNAARAVGATITTPKAYVAGVSVKELTGDGDQQLSAGDTARVTVSLHFTSGGSSATARLTSSDPYVSVTSGPVTLTGPKADRVLTASFNISVAAGVPKDYSAPLNVVLETSAPSVTTVVRLPVAPTYRQLKLPFAYEQSLITHPSGKQFFAADESPQFGRHRVYAAFRNSDGSFTQETTLSDTTNNARRPQVVVDTNGDVHVAFYQSVQSQDFAAFPRYSKYTASTGQWSTTLLTSGASINGSLEHNIALARDQNGVLHLAWGSVNGLVLTKQENGSFGAQQSIQIPVESGMLPELDLKFLMQGGRLKLFVRPIPTPPFGIGQANYRRRVQVMEYDGAAWSSLVELSAGTAEENAALPFVFNDSVRRFAQPIGSASVNLSQLAGTNWNVLQNVQDIGSADFRTGFFGLQRTSDFVTFVAKPVAVTMGSTRELREASVLKVLPGDSTRRAQFPTITQLSGNLYVFNQERRLHRQLENWFEYPFASSFYTKTSLAPAALPSVPVVTDDGATTNSDRLVHATWSSTHASGIAYYRVAVGTAPGKDDLLPWAQTTLTESTFDLGDQRLLPGQAAYVSVEARSNAVLSSAIGASDGISLATLCRAPTWNSVIAYQEPGTLVSYQGATYRSLYYTSGSIPTSQNGAWALVGACTGAPPVPACTKPQWVAGTTYPAGARVSYNGYEFIAQWASNVTPTGASGNPWKWVLNCQ